MKTNILLTATKNRYSKSIKIFSLNIKIKPILLVYLSII